MNSFYSNYRGRYSQYWVKRFGLIPQLPTHYDNANSIYELVAWLQRGFKQLMDDFANLEMEFSDFQDAIKELLENLIPELIRNFAHSKEFRDLMKDIIKDVMNDPDMKDWFTKYLEEIMKRPDFREFFKDYFKELMKDPAMKEWFKNYLKENLKELANDPEFQKILDELLKNNQYLKDLIKQLQDELDALRKLLNNSLEPNLTEIGDVNAIRDPFEWSDANENRRCGIGIATLITLEKGKKHKYTWYAPVLSFVKAKTNVNQGDVLAVITRQQWLDAGGTQGLLDGLRALNSRYIGELETGEGKLYSVRIKASAGDGLDLVMDSPIFPATYPIPAGTRLNSNFKPHRYDEEIE